MITTKNLREQWAYQQQQVAMRRRAASNFDRSDDYADLTLAKLKLEVLTDLLEDAETSANSFRNKLVEIRGETQIDANRLLIDHEIDLWDKETDK